MSTPRLRDVAEAAGVHVATASRALNADTRHLVRGQTVDRIVAEARRLGYVPDHFARGLRTRRSRTVGVLLPDITNPVFPPIVRGIEDVLAARGYTALIANTDNDLASEHQRLEALLGRSVDGVIFATARRQHEPVDVALAGGIPVVLVNRRTDRQDVSSVTTDDVLGTTMVIEHLRRLGHRSVVHLAGPDDLSTAAGRLRAFEAAGAEAGFDLGPGAVVRCPAFSVEAGRAGTEALLAAQQPFRALAAANDLLAVGAYEALRGHGLSIPQDVSVVGYNDIPFVDKLAPPLTTVRIPHRELGVQAAELLLGLLAARPEQRVLEHHELVPQLVVRGSTAAP